VMSSTPHYERSSTPHYETEQAITIKLSWWNVLANKQSSMPQTIPQAMPWWLCLGTFHLTQTLNHVELFVKYQRVLKQFKSLRTSQEKNMKNLDQTRQFFVTWDNFEQIERVKDQRLNNKIKFFFVITTQILLSIWMLENEFKQNMLN
jgi:hypothetical protein